MDKKLQKQKKIIYFFSKELYQIKSHRIFRFTFEMLLITPKYFWIIPASITKKHHRADECSKGGKVLHTKRCVRVVIDLCEMKNITGNKRDCLISAALLHDICCGGIYNKPTKKSKKNHASLPWKLIAKQRIRKRKEIFYETITNKEVYFIFGAIEGHMGRWGKYKDTIFNDGKNTKNDEYLLHIADYIASKKHIKVDIL